MYINEYFKTPVWSEDKPEFVKSLNKASDKYIKEARKRDKKLIKVSGDFGTSLISCKFWCVESTGKVKWQEKCLLSAEPPAKIELFTVCKNTPPRLQMMI